MNIFFKGCFILAITDIAAKAQSSSANFSYVPSNVSWGGPGENLHFGAFSTPFVYQQRDGFWEGNFHQKESPVMLGDPYFSDKYEVRAPVVIGVNGEILFVTSAPCYLYSLPDVADSNLIKTDSRYWSLSLSDSANSVSYASPILARIPRVIENNTVVDDVIIIGVTDSISRTNFDNSYILAVRTDHEKYTNPTDKIIWQYPPRSSYRNEDGTQLGKLYGSGALHSTGYLYWATRCGELSFSPYLQSSGAVTAERGNITTGSCGNGQGNNTLLAIRAETGMLEWSLDLPQGAASTPHITNEFLYVSSMGKIYIIDRVLGHLNKTIHLYDCTALGMCDISPDPSLPQPKLCSVPSLELLRDYFAGITTIEPSPVSGLHEDVVIPFYTCVYSILKDKQQIWGTFDASTSGRTKYSGATAYMRRSVAVSTFDKRYYVGDDMGRLHALKFKPLKARLIEKWHDDTPNKCGIISTPVVLGDGTVFVLTKEVQSSTQISRSFMVGFTKPEFSFKTKGRRVFSVSMNDDAGLLDSIYRTKEGAQPAVDQRGRIVIPSMDKKGVRAWGGGGGCAKGMEVNDKVAGPSSFPCRFCSPGTFSSSNDVEDRQCVAPPEGKWCGPHRDLGIQRQTFAYNCKVEFWCRGGNKCHEDREGITCASCQESYYSVGDFCRRCPDASWKMNALFFALVILMVAVLFKIVQCSQYTSATQFSKDVSARDQVKLYLHRMTLVDYARDRYFKVKRWFIDASQVPSEEIEPTITTVVKVANDNRFEVSKRMKVLES